MHWDLEIPLKPRAYALNFLSNLSSKALTTQWTLEPLGVLQVIRISEYLPAQNTLLVLLSKTDEYKLDAYERIPIC